MSSPTWTPDALPSEAKPWRGRGWRLVEAQHRVSTLKLVDDLGEQALLEELLEATKPPLPADCRGLDYLLATPFRYDPPYPHGSRFRRAGRTAGVFYAAERPETAVAEMAFYRLLFFAESPATPWPDDAAEYTAFAAAIASDRCLDLTIPPLDRDAGAWSDPIRYEACQVLADRAREAGITLLRYRSVRDPQHGMAWRCSPVPPSTSPNRSNGGLGGCACRDTAFRRSAISRSCDWSSDEKPSSAIRGSPISSGIADHRPPARHGRQGRSEQALGFRRLREEFRHP